MHHGTAGTVGAMRGSQIDFLRALKLGGRALPPPWDAGRPELGVGPGVMVLHAAPYGLVVHMSDPQFEMDESRLKMVVHDFSGHPGQIRLSRELARLGHTVQHQFCESFTTGQGATAWVDGDPESFSVKGISLGAEFDRYSPLRRLFQEFRYGWLAIRAAASYRPDIAIYSNMPLVPLVMVSVALKARRIPFVLWWQDIYSDAIGTHARARLGRLGGVVAWLVDRAECGCARRAAAIVPITDAFLDRLEDWGIGRDKATVIPNWGALDEVVPRPRSNPWSAAHGLDAESVVMYAGTLGLKHDPSVIAELLRCTPADCRVVVVSQGLGRQWLEETCCSNPRLLLLDYQPYEQLSDMLASADVLVAILEEDASRYSVPSKVLNYLCAGRPVLAIMPLENAVAQMVASNEAGIVVSPGDNSHLANAIDLLLTDQLLRARMAENARNYAQNVFGMNGIANSFEHVINRVVASGSVEPTNR